MWDQLVRVVPVFLAAMVKFLFGPVAGFVAGLNPFVTILVTVCGMMTTVFLLTFFGGFIKRRIQALFPRSKLFSKYNRRMVTIWKRYGIMGVAALTPVMFTPIGGTLIAVSFGTDWHKILIYMFVSAVLWACVTTAVVYLIGPAVVEQFGFL